MGWIIHTFEIQPFIVTLAGMFLARGLCYTISTESITISDPTTAGIAQTRLYGPGACSSRSRWSSPWPCW